LNIWRGPHRQFLANLRTNYIVYIGDILGKIPACGDHGLS
jgi:hypothetical protein